MKRLSVQIKFFLFLGLITLGNNGFAAKENPYAIFDAEIYTQKRLTTFLQARVHTSVDLNDPEVQSTILSELSFQKLKQLTEKLFQQYDAELKDLAVLMEKYKKGSGEKALEVTKQVLGAAAGLGMLAVPGVGTGAEVLAGMRIAAAVQGSLAMGSAAAGGMQEFLRSDGILDVEKLQRAVERQKKQLILGMHEETQISDIELLYILRKPVLHNPFLEKKVEETLITMRRTEVPMELYREYLLHCLQLPFQRKPIFPSPVPAPHPVCYLELGRLNEQTYAQYGLSSTQIEARHKLLSYEPEVRQEFDRIAIAAKYASNPESTLPTQRRFFYFWGDPGVGKTTAARELAAFLNLPLHETNIRTEGDISQQALEGEDGLKIGANMGHLVRAITKSFTLNEAALDLKIVECTVEPYSEYGLDPHFSIPGIPAHVEGTSCKNSILVINDFDRLLLDPGTSTPTLAFFLDYLDPAKQDFFSTYFQFPVSIEDLIIIITGNNPIPETERAFQALKDRVVELEFNEFPRECRQRILRDFLTAVARKLKLVNVDDLRILEQASAVSSIREGKKIIEKLLLDCKKQNPVDLQIREEEQDEPDLPLRIQAPDHKLPTTVNLVLPPLCEDPEAKKKVKSMESINTDVRLLFSPKQFEQAKGVNNLFGSRGRIYNSWGWVESLWSTKSWQRLRRTYRETQGGIEALANRLARFELPAQRHEVIEFHVCTLQSLADALLAIKLPEEDEKGEGFVYKQLKKDSYKKANLAIFIDHFEKFSDFNKLREGFALLSQDDQLPAVHLSEATQTYLRTASHRFSTRLLSLKERFSFVYPVSVNAEEDDDDGLLD